MPEKQKILLVFSATDWTMAEGIQQYTEARLPPHIRNHVEFVPIFSAVDLMTYVDNLSAAERSFIRGAVISDYISAWTLEEPGTEKAIANEQKVAELEAKGLPNSGDNGAWLAGELAKMNFGNKPPAIGLITFIGDIIDIKARFPGQHVIDSDLGKAGDFIIAAVTPERARREETTAQKAGR